MKTHLRNFLLTSITLNELFLGSLLLSVYFSVLIVKTFTPVSLENILVSFLSFLFVLLFFYSPLYSSAKVIFTRTQSKYGLRSTFFTLRILGTIWSVILLLVGFITIFTRLVSFDLFGPEFLVFSKFGPLDYILIFYLLTYFVRIILLFFFSGYLKIKRIGIVHMPMSRTALTLISLYSLYLLWKQPVQTGELLIDTLFYLFQSVAIVYATGSMIFQIYYMFSRKEPILRFKDINN